MPHAIEAAKRESREETGLIAKNIRHFTTARSGATVVWDLIYYIIDDFVEDKKGQVLEADEVIDIEWKTFAEVKKNMQRR